MNRQSTIKIAFCWPEISGYMASCFRMLSQVPGVDTKFIALRSGESRSETSFKDDIVEGLNISLLNESDWNNFSIVRESIEQFSPDVVVVCGWFHSPFRRLTRCSKLRNVRWIMAMDTPWQGTLRQALGLVLLRQFLRRFDAVFVAGERTWQYAKILGVPERKLRRGTYGFNYELFQDAAKNRAEATRWPRKFVFVGRYSSEKGIDLLLSAYGKYRKLVSDPWPIDFCGRGPLAKGLAGLEGAKDRGFVQPDDLPEILAECGVFVLPSLFEPWGVAIAEAAASGLPIICSEACGASVDIVRHLFNGYVAATGDSTSLLSGLLYMHENYSRLETFGKRSEVLSEPWSSRNWCAKIIDLCDNAVAR